MFDNINIRIYKNKIYINKIHYEETNDLCLCGS